MDAEYQFDLLGRYFREVCTGARRVLLRKMDFAFRSGERILLREIDSVGIVLPEPTGNKCIVEITSIETSAHDAPYEGLEPGYCLLSIRFDDKEGVLESGDLEKGLRLSYRQAVDDALVVSLESTTSGDAVADLNRLIAWETQVALDPAVSKPAQKLQDDAYRLGMETAAVICDNQHDRARTSTGAARADACAAAIRREMQKGIKRGAC